MRIVVVGTTGSGKTTLARRLADRLGVPHIELDTLFWLPEWQQRTSDDFREQVKAAVAGKSWVTDGNYMTDTADLTWPNADYIVWVDTSFWVAFPRLIRRSVSRAWTGDLLWGINRERWDLLFWNRHSILIYFLLSFGRNRQRFAARSRLPEYADRWVRLRNDREIEEWVASLPKADTSRAGDAITRH